MVRQFEQEEEEEKIHNDAFYGFPGNSIKPRYERYRRYCRLSVGEVHPPRCHYTHTPILFPEGVGETAQTQGVYLVVGAAKLNLQRLLSHPILILLYLLYLSCLDLIGFLRKP
jgi:hypothetical protein